MQINIPSFYAKLVRGLPALTAFALISFSLLGLAPTTLAQTSLALSNNYFVTGDYVVGGVGLRGLAQFNPQTGTYLAGGTIRIPDPNTVPAFGVPQGASCRFFFRASLAGRQPFAYMRFLSAAMLNYGLCRLVAQLVRAPP
jgi:hypothetical protein